MKGRYIGESIRLISDILDISNKLNIPGYMFTVDLQNEFEFMDHVFLVACLENLDLVITL